MVSKKTKNMEKKLINNDNEFYSNIHQASQKEVQAAIKLGESYKRKTHYFQKGTSGVSIYAGYYDEEYLTKLRGIQRADIFDEMWRSDDQITMLWNIVKNAMLGASFMIEPVDDSDEEKEIAEFLEFALFEDIGSLDGLLNKTWDEFVSEAASMIRHGFAIFEEVHKIVTGHPKWGNYLGLKNLAFRSQRTIEEWILARDGRIDHIIQRTYGDHSGTFVIPGEFLLVLSVNKEGDNYEGVSMLRPIYGNWLRKNLYRRLEGIGFERTSVGTPIGTIPDGYEDSDQSQAFEEVLESYTTHESNYLTKPEGWDLDNFELSFKANEIRKAIQAEDAGMAKSFVANFLELGMQGSGGSFALGQDLSDIFFNGIGHLNNQICNKISRKTARTLVDAKYGKRVWYPKVKCSMSNEKAGEEFAKVMKLLKEAGLIDGDPKLKDFIRSTYKLPERIEGFDQGGSNGTAPNGNPTSDPQNNTENEDEEENVSLSEIKINLENGNVIRIQENETILAFYFNNEVWSNMESEDYLSRNGFNVSDVSYGGAYTKYALEDELKFESSRMKRSGLPEGMLIKIGMNPVKISGEDKETDADFAPVEPMEEYSFEGFPKEKRLELAEVTKNITNFIDKQGKEFEQIQKDYLLVRSSEYISKIEKILRLRPESQWRSAVLSLSMPKKSEYKQALFKKLADTGNKMTAQTLKEVKMPNLKLDEIDDKFKTLPKKTRDKIRAEVDLLLERQDTDLKSNMMFMFNEQVDKQSVERLIDDIKAARDQYINGPATLVAGTTSVSRIAAQARMNVFYHPEVEEQIDSFIFSNPNPKTAVCKNLTGRVMRKDDPGMFAWAPPLHVLCKSYLVAQLVGNPNNVKPEEEFGPKGTPEQVEKMRKETWNRGIDRTRPIDEQLARGRTTI